MVARLEAGIGRPDAVDNPDTLVTRDASRRAAGNIPFQDVEIGTANRSLGDDYDCVIGRLNEGFGPLFQGLEAGTALHQGFHGTIHLNSRTVRLGESRPP